MLNRSIACCIFVSLLSSNLLCAGDVDPSQKEWYDKYKKQENVPDPAKQLLNTDKEPALEEGFEPLCNGKDLSGWTPKGGTCKFEVVDGIIVGTCVPGSPSTYLSTDKADYADFIFTCDLKWEVGGNSGVMFRAKTREGKKGETVVYGPQAEMEDPAQGRGWSGGIYGQSCGGYFYPNWLTEHKEIRSAINKDDWNRITIHAKGDVVKTWVNGVPAAHWVGDGTYREGFFSLQIHKGQAGKVHFRNIRVKELK